MSQVSTVCIKFVKCTLSLIPFQLLLIWSKELNECCKPCMHGRTDIDEITQMCLMCVCACVCGCMCVRVCVGVCVCVHACSFVCAFEPTDVR